jgi:polyisoprenoid-binding protein YceI
MTIATIPFSGVFDADVNHSSFEAATRHMGVGRFRTRFEDVAAALTADEAGLRLDGEAQVESISLHTPPEFREHVVNGEDLFDAGRYPTIRFSSSDVELGDEGSATLRGELTIKNVTRAITASGTYRPPTEDPYGSLRAGLDLSTTIDRRDFGLSWQAQLPNGGNVLEWEVDIDVHLEFVKAS